MLHFFRRIRRDLLANSQFFKYLKYAVGEIVLVVLGIVIALYINNQNEISKNQEKFDQILVDVERELEENLELTREVVNEFARRDSLYLKLFIDSARLENISTYGYVLMSSVSKIPLRDESFKKLIQIDGLTTEQEALRDELIFVNNVGSNYFEAHANRTIKDHEEIVKGLMKYDWYEQFIRYQLDDERIIDFFINDPNFKKWAIYQFYWNHDYYRDVDVYDRLALETYEHIFHYLNSQGIKHSDTLLFEYNPNEFKHYLGKYNPQWCSSRDFPDDSCAVSLENGKLYWNGYKSDGPDTRVEISPINRFRFRDERGAAFYHLNFDEKGEVSGVRCNVGPNWVYELEKVR